MNHFPFTLDFLQRVGPVTIAEKKRNLIITKAISRFHFLNVERINIAEREEDIQIVEKAINTLSKSNDLRLRETRKKIEEIRNELVAINKDRNVENAKGFRRFFYRSGKGKQKSEFILDEFLMNISEAFKEEDTGYISWKYFLDFLRAKHEFEGFKQLSDYLEPILLLKNRDELVKKRIEQRFRRLKKTSLPPTL